MSVYGSRLFGKVDEVPGLFHVATKCGHINYVPLIPMKSYIILRKTGNSFRGVPIPLSLKSWGMAWMKFFAWVAMIAGIVVVIVGLSAHQPIRSEDWLPGILILAVGAALLFIAYRFKPLTHAGYDRACTLAEVVGLNEAGMAQLRTIYGRPPTAAVNAARVGVPPRVPLPSQRK